MNTSNGLLSGIGGAIFQALTGTDPSLAQAQLDQAEQTAIVVGEVVIALMFLQFITSVFILLEMRRA